MTPKKRIDVQIEIAKAALKLGQSDRETWIAHLLDDRGANLDSEDQDSEDLFDIPFPTLSRGETLADYLMRTWHASEHELESRDRLRSAVVNLIRGECDNLSVSNPDNVLGRLLGDVPRVVGIGERLRHVTPPWTCRRPRGSRVQ